MNEHLKHNVSHKVYNVNTPESTSNEVTPYNDTCQSSSGDLVEIRGLKDNMEGYKYSKYCTVPLLNVSNTNIPNIVITGCNFTNCDVSLCSKLKIMKRPLVLLVIEGTNT